MIQNDGITEIFQHVASNPDMAKSFQGITGDNAHIIDVAKRQETRSRDVIESKEGGYDLIIDVKGVEQDDALDLTKAEEATKDAEDFDAIKSEMGKQTDAEKDGTEPDSQGIPKGAGKCIAVRRDGATVRDGPDIDNSNEIMKIRQNKTVYYDKRVS